ncbi:carboxypeptidase M32 [bacterium]|nr:carboxypeptidase M32 [bacterium]
MKPWVQYLDEFKSLSERVLSLEYAQALIHWDMNTGAPKKGMGDKAKMLGTLGGESVKLLTSPKMNELLEILEAHKESLEPNDYQHVKHTRKRYDQMMKIPPKEYEEYLALCAEANQVWEEAKTESNFNLFAPYLKKIVEALRNFIVYRGSQEDHPYNTLLDDYEEGMTVEKLDIFFNTLRERIVPLVHKIREKSQPECSFLAEKYPILKQKEFSDFIAKYIGYDFDAGMIKESMHPFTLGFGPNDVRITTHYHENNLMSAIFSTIHEGGHAIYEQQVSQNLAGTLLAEGTSMGIHESQSRMFENLFGRSLAFWKPIYAKTQEYFPTLSNFTLEQFYKGINITKPSLIRIEADELTYSLHVMVRYDLEKALFSGACEVEDLPELWNKKMEEYLGVTPENDSVGVLQDVHWGSGLFGYFPSYALGNAYASQFFNTMNKEFSVFDELEKGDFTKIKEWLKKHIHQFGKTKKPEEILIEATGEGLNPNHFAEYLEKKFTSLYNL